MSRLAVVCLLACFTLASCAHRHCGEESCAPTKVTAAKPEFDGYCAYAVCTKKKLVKGKADYQATYQDKVYHFSSARARDNFVRNIDKNAMDAQMHWQSMMPGARR